MWGVLWVHFLILGSFFHFFFGSFFNFHFFEFDRNVGGIVEKLVCFI